MMFIVIALLLLAAIALPGLWVKRVLSKYSEPPDRYREQGTGAELARHLLDRLDLMFTYGQLSDATREAIIRSVEGIEDLEFRTRNAIYLLLISPDYAVQS